jgi:hypothetical protein
MASARAKQHRKAWCGWRWRSDGNKNERRKNGISQHGASKKKKKSQRKWRQRHGSGGNSISGGGEIESIGGIA